MARSGKVRVDIVADASGMKRGVSEAEGHLSKLNTVGRAALHGLGIAAVAGTGLLVAGAFKATEAASDLNEQVNKAGAVFKASSPSIIAWSKTTAQSIGVSQRAALEAAGTFGNMLVPLGLAPKKAGEMSVSMVKLAADMASFNNADPTKVLEDLRSGLAGESEPLRKYGISLNDARLKQEAMQLGLYKGKGILDANAKAQAAYALIIKDSANAHGDFARTAGGLANQERIARAQLEDTAATTGKVLIPVMAKVLTVVNDILLWSQRNWPKFKQITTDAFRGAQRAAQVAMGWFDANVLPTIRAIVSGAKAFWSRFGGDITAAFNLAKRVVGDAMKTIKSVIELILAVIRGDWGKAWSSLKGIVSSAMDAVVAVLRNFPSIFFNLGVDMGKSLAQGILSALTSIPSAIAGAIGVGGSAPVDLGRGGLTGRGKKASERRPGQLPFFPGGTPLTPSDLAGSIIGDLHRDDSLQDKRTRASSATASARAGITNPDELALRADRAVLRVRRGEIIRDMATVRAAAASTKALITARKKKRAARYKALAAIHGTSQAAVDQRNKITQAIESDNAAIRSRYDELNALIRQGADLQAEAADLGFDIGALTTEIAAMPDVAPVDTVPPGTGSDPGGSSDPASAGVSPDAQAQIDQATNNATTAQRGMAIGESFIRTIFGSSSIDPASGSVNVNINVEGSLVHQGQLANFIAAALGGQGSVPASSFATGA